MLQLIGVNYRFALKMATAVSGKQRPHVNSAYIKKHGPTRVS